MSTNTYEGWVVVFNSGTDYEADLVRDRLDDAGVSAVVLTQRDHAFNLTMGDLAQVRVLVPPDQVAAANEVLDSLPFEDNELDDAALRSSSSTEAYDADSEAMFDSGIEKINLSPPPERDEDEED